jgi:hypothetical protein
LDAKSTESTEEKKCTGTAQTQRFILWKIGFLWEKLEASAVSLPRRQPL